MNMKDKAQPMLGAAIKIIGVSTLALVVAGAANAQSAPAPTPAKVPDTNDIVVTGFRASLDKALSLKRLSVGSVDAIVAEDISKFPDQNLAESLQRIPGIAVNKDGGEGREITVRGLAGQFTAVRVNGMEAQASTFLAGSGGGANRERSFDFNLFASELFRSLVVHKTAEASIDEGSLGAVVDLNTGHPLGAKAGLHGAVSGQGAYNDLSKNTGPKASGLINWRNAAGTFGINFSAAYSKTNTLELGNNTTRWAQAVFNSVTTGGVTTNCFANKLYVPSAACDQAALSFHPRIPRYGIITHDRERQGYTGAIEWQPSSKTHLEIDGLYSRYHEIRTEKWAEILFRNNEAGINVVNPTYDANGNMVSATFNNAFDRHENFYMDQRDSFYQVSGKLDQQLSENLKATLSGGMSKADENIPIQTTVAIDNLTPAGIGASQGYSYNYTNQAFPVLTFGTGASDPTNPANYQFTLLRDRPTDITNEFKTAKLDLEWKIAHGFKARVGGVYRQFDYNTVSAFRDSQACTKAGAAPAWGPGTSAICTSANNGYSLTANNIGTDLITLGNNGQPGGTTSSFVVANLASAAAFSNLYNLPALQSLDAGNNRSITEKVKGGYLQVDADGELLHLKYALSAGMRYVATDLTSTALSVVPDVNKVNQLVPTTVGNTYDNWLPSFNLNLYPTKNVIVRAAVAKVLTRPSLGNLSPGATVDSFNFKVTFNNPKLLPAVATNYDLGVEWYFAPQSVLSISAFSKQVQNGTQSVVTQGTFASTGLPSSILATGTPGYNAVNGVSGTDNWSITTITNSPTTSTIKGLEFGVQAPFRFLPGVFKRFGIIANATVTDSQSSPTVVGADTTTKAGTPAVAATKTTPAVAAVTGGLVVPAAVVVNSTYVGASKLLYNVTLYYEDSRFGARVSYAYRGPYYDATSATNGNVFDGYTATKTVDASIRFTVLKNLDLTLDGNNLLDNYVYHYTDATAQRNYESFHTGRNIVFGARLKF